MDIIFPIISMETQFLGRLVNGNMGRKSNQQYRLEEENNQVM